MIFLAYVLGADDGSSCCQCGKCLNDQDIDGIHQGYGGYGCGAYVADHHGIDSSHEGVQYLFKNNGHQQAPEHFVCKNMLLFFHLSPPSFIFLYTTG